MFVPTKSVLIAKVLATRHGIVTSRHSAAFVKKRDIVACIVIIPGSFPSLGAFPPTKLAMWPSILQKTG